MRRCEGTILTPKAWIRGTIEFDDRITSIQGLPVSGPGSHEPVILPGFMDLHVHGGGGVDIMNGNGSVVSVARMHARHGTTSMLATTVCASRLDLERVSADVASAILERDTGCAKVLGTHLEGPYINMAKLGAQPNNIRSGSLEEILSLNELAPIRIVTLAPELDGHLGFIRSLSDRGIVVQIGHTLGSYETGVAALQAGASGFTHLFNAMTGMHHRTPGMVSAAMAHADYAEIIPDLLHVHPALIHAAIRAIPKLYCVTDATAGAGMPDGTYTLGTQSVTKCNGGVRLADGTLAGSTLTMDNALRNLVSIGLSLSEAACRVSTFPADHLGIEDRGRLAQGCWADFVVMSPLLDLLNVFVEGESIDLANA